MLSRLRRSSISTLSAIALALWPAAAMAVSDIHDYSTTAASNTDLNGISIAEGSARASVNNAIRELLAELKRADANIGSDIASAGTTAICASGTSKAASVTGTTTITSLGTAAAGCWRIITFTGALTLTHNATSLILPTGSNITTTAGAVGSFLSLGSGNWRMITYSAVPYLSAANTFTAAQTIDRTTAGTLLNVTTTDAGASGATVAIGQDSASPAASDVFGRFLFNGEDSAGNTQTYNAMSAIISDPTSTSEDSRLVWFSSIAGTLTAVLGIGDGVVVGADGTTFKGVGTVNATAGLYIAGHGTVAQVVSDTDATYTTLGTILPVDNSIPQNTEGDEVLSVAITPVNASSILRITATMNLGNSTAGSEESGCALFVDSTAAALDAASTFTPNNTTMTSLSLRHEVSAASTSARTYKIRCGSAVAADAFLNGDGASRMFGGVATSELVVEEVLPQ